MTNTIPVPRAWLERLVELSHALEKIENKKPEYIGHFIGYVQAAETLLTNGEKEGK